MPSAGPERTAQVIAENVVSAFEQGRERAGPMPIMYETLVVALAHEVLSLLPSGSSAALTTACNRALDDIVGVLELGGPRVEAVDLDDGSVTMRAG